jgi:serine O-acetyltransferase
MNTLYIYAGKIGPGLFMQHGFATIIAAKTIGKDCWINQQVTIGFTNETDHPIIEDNVIVYADAKIIGDVTVCSNSEVGANAVVIKDVPENCTVVGVPAYIVKKNGIKMKEKI